MWPRIKYYALSFVAVALVLVAAGGVNPTSVGIFYEPEIPSQLRK